MKSQFPDPTDWLQTELAELRGFVRKVPALVQAERDARWDAIGSSPGDPVGPDIIDLYEEASGPEEGYGHADWDGLSYRTAIVTGWELFRSTMSDLLEVFLREATHPITEFAADLLDEEIRKFDRRFDHLVKRYSDWAGFDMKSLDEWPVIRHVEELRNAVVHNHGRYTKRYAELPLALPVRSLGRTIKPGEALEMEEQIPLTEDLVLRALSTLQAVAVQTRDYLGLPDEI